MARNRLPTIISNMVAIKVCKKGNLWLFCYEIDWKKTEICCINFKKIYKQTTKKNWESLLKKGKRACKFLINFLLRYTKSALNKVWVTRVWLQSRIDAASESENHPSEQNPYLVVIQFRNRTHHLQLKNLPFIDLFQTTIHGSFLMQRIIK